MLLLEFCNITKVFRRGWLTKTETIAAKDISFLINSGEIFGLMGESGSGKSTLGKLAMGLLTPSSGQILWEGKNFVGLKSLPKHIRLSIQGIAQNPYGAFNSKHSIGYALAEPLIYHGLYKKKQEIDDAIKEILDLVNLGEDCLKKYPRQLSGGQLQRLALARILLMHPKLIVADEPTTMMDLSNQAQIIQLIKSIHEKTKVAILFISHDLPVVVNLAHRIGIMYGGRMVEIGSGQDILTNPLHPYTQSFLAAAKEEIFSELNNSNDGMMGCIYRSNCKLAQEICEVKNPQLSMVQENHLVACHFANVEKRRESYAQNII